LALIDMRHVEERAATMVVSELGALRWERRDVPGAPPRTYDFDIVFAGHVEPLEVTTSLDEQVMTTFKRTGGVMTIAANVQRLWFVSGEETWTDATGKKRPFDRKRVVELLPTLVEHLEQDGVTSFDLAQLAWPLAYGLPARHQATAQELYSLGVRGGSSMVPPPSEQPGISLHLGGGGVYGQETLTAILEEIAARADNRAKLAGSLHAARRHLFVAVTSGGSDDMARWALDQYLDGWVYEEDPPLPSLPPEVTTIWAGTTSRGIYATPPDGWTRFGTKT
jgi:hypothetical protein